MKSQANKQNDLEQAVLELSLQLRSQKIPGLPKQWFEHKSPTPDPTVLSTDRRDRYQALFHTAQNCQACRLHETRNKVVFGCGEIISPPIAFVGEGPGADEDKQGEPFVGKAGGLLTAAITKGLKLSREQVYICNVVKCRPPENRTPLEDEVSQCFSYLEQQLSIVSPRVIVTLGAPALRALCGNKGGITRIRGNWLEWRGIPLMPTFHPAYILRNPPAKKDFWQDLQAVMAKLGLEQ